ncbi:MAG TPA: hypothetical protein EYG99_02920, partial [Candidatus Pacebacteria bacterium]|nr:hypothetical protein [Candidatus Paceibacterota bacterium]
MRLFGDKNLSVGDIISFIAWENGREFAQVKIVEVNEVRFCELEEDHWDGHEKYSSDTEMYQT